MNPTVKISQAAVHRARVRNSIWCAFWDWVHKRSQIINCVSGAVAAIGILSSGGIYIHDALQARTASLEGAVIYSSTSQLSLLISNTGGVDLVVTRVQLESGANAKSLVQLTRNGILVEHGKSEILTSEKSQLNSTVQFHETEEGPDQFARATQIPCHAVIDYVVAGKKSKKATIDFTCYAATLIGEEDIKWMSEVLAPVSGVAKVRPEVP
jgi:hypothetical protein